LIRTCKLGAATIYLNLQMGRNVLTMSITNGPINVESQM